MQVFIGLICLVVVVFLSSVATGGDPCENTKYQTHYKGAHEFKTSSAFVARDNTLHIYWTCVHNLDVNPRNDLRIDWYVPGPNAAWIAGAQRVDTPRRSPDRRFRVIRGRLEYGNLGAVTVAEFLGDASDASKADKNQRQANTTATQLRNRPVKETTFARPKEGWSDAFRLFFPTDRDNTSDSMIQLNAKVSVDFFQEKARTSVSYNAMRLEGRNQGDPTQVTYVVRFPSREKFLAKIVYQQLPYRPQPLGHKGQFEFLFEQADRYRITYMEIQFRGPRNKLLGLLKASILSPANP